MNWFGSRKLFVAQDYYVRKRRERNGIRDLESLTDNGINHYFAYADGTWEFFPAAARQGVDHLYRVVGAGVIADALDAFGEQEGPCTASELLCSCLPNAKDRSYAAAYTTVISPFGRSEIKGDVSLKNSAGIALRENIGDPDYLFRRVEQVAQKEGIPFIFTPKRWRKRFFPRL